MKAKVVVAALLLTVVACHYRPWPVRLEGRSSDLANLAGEWVGEYSGSQSGRSGSIIFRLAAGRDTAYGDVLMIDGRSASAATPSAHGTTGASLHTGSDGSGPWIASYTAARSATERANGPTWSSEPAKSATPVRETRPYVGLRPKMPQKAAGTRMEPPVSDPRATGQSPAATAAAEPPLEPPAIRPGFQGLQVVP